MIKRMLIAIVVTVSLAGVQAYFDKTWKPDDLVKLN